MNTDLQLNSSILVVEIVQLKAVKTLKSFAVWGIQHNKSQQTDGRLIGCLSLVFLSPGIFLVGYCCLAPFHYRGGALKSQARLWKSLTQSSTSDESPEAGMTKTTQWQTRPAAISSV